MNTFSAYVTTADSIPGADAGLLVQKNLDGAFTGTEWDAVPADINVADEAFSEDDFDALLAHLGFERAAGVSWEWSGDQWTARVERHDMNTATKTYRIGNAYESYDVQATDHDAATAKAREMLAAGDWNGQAPATYTVTEILDDEDGEALGDSWVVKVDDGRA